MIISKTDCHRLKGDGEVIKNIIYYRVSLTCKAGKKRKSKAKGMRLVSTIKGIANEGKTSKSSALHKTNKILHAGNIFIVVVIRFTDKFDVPKQ